MIEASAARLFEVLDFVRTADIFREMFLLYLAASFGGAGLLAWGQNWLSLIPWRRALGAHWTERARILFPARVAAVANLWIIPICCILAGQLLFPELQFTWLPSALAGWLGTVLGTYPFDREVFPWLRFRPWLRQALVAWFLRFAIWFVLILAAWSMPEQLGWQAWAIAAAVLTFSLAMSWGLGMALLRWLRVTKPPPERLQWIISGAARRIGVPIKGVWLLDTPVSYAAAFPTTREMIFSKRLLELHPDEEVAAICAHELGHLAESKPVLAGRVIGSLWFFPWVFVRPVVHAWEVGGVFWLILVTVLIVMFSRRLSRHMEVRADQFAHDHQLQEGTYARALERLYEANQVPAVMPDQRQIHPHLYDRLLNAGITPEYPRPAAAVSTSWPKVAMSVVLGILIACRLVQLYWLSF